ncbi:glycosyl hydrolase family 18 protein [Veillonella sp.]|uniref:glycosyl hydrolase family 18 protein n=1 Tax=Veillonella sp. TaxID=1926307 RepID=UPI0025F1ACB2|nr:glycosyl hydrolase family 18 protein [Veillonella sp.]
MKQILTRAVLAALVTLSASGVQAASIEVTKENSSLIKMDTSVKQKTLTTTDNVQVINRENLGNTARVQPITIRTLAGQTTVVQEAALVEGSHILIPLSVYQTVNLNRVTLKDAKAYITLPAPRRAGDMSYNGDRRNGERTIRLATIQRGDVIYVDMSATSPILGVEAIRTKSGIELKAPLGALDIPARKEIKGSLAWVFDPFISDAYGAPVAKTGTSVVSPTWFDLSKNGLTVKPGMDLKYLAIYKFDGYRVWPLVTNNFDPDFTSKILNDKKYWQIIADDMVLYALTYGYDGYNLDFEDVHYKDRAKLTSFVAYLTKRLHEFNIFVSMDVTGYSDSENWSMVYDRKHLGELVDYMVLMAYDEVWASSPEAGPVASYPWVKRNATALTREVSPEKIVLGVPYYMRVWQRTISVDDKGKVTYGKAKSRTLTMKEAEELKATYADRVQWDDDLKLHYLRFGNDELGEQLLAYAETGKEPRIAGGLRNKSATISEVWFEDEASMAYKRELMSELKLAGFAAWRKGFETPTFRQFMYNDAVPAKNVPHGTAKKITKLPSFNGNGSTAAKADAGANPFTTGSETADTASTGATVTGSFSNGTSSTKVAITKES